MKVDKLALAMANPKHRASLEKRLAIGTMAKSKDDCWEWTKSTNDSGYGLIGSSRGVSSFRTHRVSWALANGPIPEGMCICHRCDNPPCNNPDHLFLGTKADNTEDMVSKGRMSPPPHSYGEAHHAAKFGPEIAMSIRLDRRPAHIIASEYGISTKTVYRHRRGETWVRGGENV